MIRAPAISDYPIGVAESASSQGRHDAIVAMPSIGRVPGDDLPWVLDEMFRTAGKFVYVAVPRARSLIGTGAESVDADWWKDQLEGAARRRPRISWALRFGRRVVRQP